MSLTVVVADDHKMVRMGIAMILSDTEDLTVVAQCADGVEAAEAIRTHRPDVALLDIQMPRLNGLEVARLAPPETQVVMVTTFDDEEYVDRALEIGVSGFLLKDAGPALLVEAVRAAAAGDALISPSLTIALLERSSRRAPSRSDDLAGLSPREIEVVRLLGEGRTNAEIADHLHLSVATVKSHLSNISARLGTRNRVEVAARAWRAGLYD